MFQSWGRWFAKSLPPLSSSSSPFQPLPYLPLLFPLPPILPSPNFCPSPFTPPFLFLPYSHLPTYPSPSLRNPFPSPLIGDPGITLGKILGVAVVRRRVLRHFGNGTQQFNKSGFIPVNLSKSVEFEILQVGKKLNEQ